MVQVLLFILLIPFNYPLYKIIKEFLFVDHEEFKMARHYFLTRIPQKNGHIKKAENIYEQVKLSLFYLICLCLLLLEFCLLYDVLLGFF